MGSALRYIVENGDRIGSYVLLLIMVGVLGYVVYALATGKVPSPGDYKRLSARVTECEIDTKRLTDALYKANQELADARVLYAGAAKSIEYLERDVRDRDSDIVDLTRRLARLEVPYTQREGT